MNHKLLSALSSAAVSVAALALLPHAAHAGDVKLKDGSVWRGDAGTRVRVTFIDKSGAESTLDGVVLATDKNYLKVEVEAEGGSGGKVSKTITSRDIRKIEVIGSDGSAGGLGDRSGTSEAGPSSSGNSSSGKSSSGSAQPGNTKSGNAKSGNTKSGAPGSAKSGSATGAAAGKSSDASDKRTVFLLPWDGMVGVGARHDEIEAVAREADKLGPGQIIVIEINSGGGLVMEGDLIDVSMRELRERHRLVAWIKEAISAAAFTALHCNEIYFRREATLGSITMFSGGGDAIEGPELDAWLQKCGDVCEETNRNRWIGEAMVSNEPELSYDILEDGSIKWYNTMEGKFDLSDKTTNLTLEAPEAERCKFSQGTADTRDDLLKLMDLDPAKVVWSKAGEDIHRRWNRTLEQVREDRLQILLDFQNPPGSTEIEQMERRIARVKEIVAWHDRCFVGLMFDREGGAPSINPPCEGPQYQPKGATSIKSIRELSKRCWEDVLDSLKKELARMKRNG